MNGYNGGLRAGIVVVVMCGSACGLQDDLVPCGDLVCPSDEVCTVGGCATADNIAACDGMADGTTCMSSSGDSGVCSGGSCRTGLCGNGKLDPGEACDDGNQVSGDGCRGDCKKIEVCGDGIVDANEACDDGNTNAADGCDACQLTMWNATTIVGGEVGGTTVGLTFVFDVAGDSLGRAYFIDGTRVRRVELDGSLTTVAGTGVPGTSGDGGPAASAQLLYPEGIAVDGLGRLYIADANASTVRRVDIDGTITTIAGFGGSGFGGDGAQATTAQLRNPDDVAVDGLGRVVIADQNNHRIRRIELDGTISTIAGTGTPGFTGDNGAATGAEIQDPTYLAIDSSGTIYFIDRSNARIRKITAGGIISTIAGTGTNGVTAEGVHATAAMMTPVGNALVGQGRVIFGDNGSGAIRVRRIETDGTLGTVAGIGTGGFAGDGGPATSAELGVVFGVAFDGLGRMIISDPGNGRVRRVATDGTITSIAGNGAYGSTPDGFAATSDTLASASDVAFDDMGRLVIADRLNLRVRRIELDGTLVTLAGNGSEGYGMDGVPATTIPLVYPTSVAIDPQHRVLFADGCRVRALDGTGTLTTVAGSPSACGFGGDSGPATSAQLGAMTALAVDATGNLYIADAPNQRIRMVSAGTITTIAGNGATGSVADGVAATAALLSNPTGVAVDSTGRVLIADAGSHKIRRVELDHTISTVAGTGTPGSNGDCAAATSAQLHSPARVAIGPMDRIYIADTGNERVREIDTNNNISTIAGIGTAGFLGDGGAATSAMFNSIQGLAIDASGDVAIADDVNNLVRLRDSGGTIRTIAGKVDPDDTGLATTGRLADPTELVVTSSFTLAAGGSSGVVELVAGGALTDAIGRYPQSIATGSLARFRNYAFGTIGGIAFDASTGLIYVVETSANRIHIVTRVNPNDPTTWTIAAFANTTGVAGNSDGAVATATFRSPTGLYLDPAAHVLYIADTGNHAIRALDLSSNIVTTVVDSQHRFGFGGDGGDAGAALLYLPGAVTRCPNGDFFIADTGNNRVRRVDGSNVITTVLGDGTPSSSGQGAPANTFSVNAPLGLACDATGNVFVSSTTAVRILAADDSGVVDGTGAVSTIYGAPPRVAFPDSNTECLTGVAVTNATTIEVADSCTGLVVALTRVAQQ